MARSGEGFKVTFSAPELRDALKNIDSYNNKARVNLEEAVKTSAENLKKSAQGRVSVKTGSLKKSIKTRFDNKTTTGYVVAKSPHAHLVEFGAKAATVKPDTKKALAIPGVGPRMSAKIPARKARPFMRPAWEEEKPKLIEAVRKALE